MLIKDSVFYSTILFGVLSIGLLVISVNNRHKALCWFFVGLAIFCMMCQIMTLKMMDIFYVASFGLEMLGVFFCAVVAVLLDIISIIVNVIKIKKLRGSPEARSRKQQSQNKLQLGAIITMSVLALVPIVLLAASIIANKHYIKSSNLIVVYRSAGNGGFDGKTFAYAIGEDFCKQFDLGIETDGYRLHEYLPAGAKEIRDLDNIPEYEITFDTSWENNGISIHKDGEEVCRVNNSTHFFNISLTRAFYIE